MTGLVLVRKMLDYIKEWRCCTDQKTEYRTAQAAAMVIVVFIVESVKVEYSLGAGVEVDEELARSWSPWGGSESRIND